MGASIVDGEDVLDEEDFLKESWNDMIPVGFSGCVNLIGEYRM